MPTYDFRSLNDKEFEAIAIDLLRRRFETNIERFKPGKDGGVDGRWFSDGSEFVIQCKHWVGSSFSALRRALIRDELPKLANLTPGRYILVTSLPLSRTNKNELARALQPYITSPSDVIGAEDLNDMLGEHPEVEQRHYKLWLTSSATLAALINRAILGRSASELDDIRQMSHLYVQTKDHELARKRLAENRVLIVTGQPGIGKTTLARQLILEHVARGFELVVLDDRIEEAEAVFNEERDQIFYFDDFLGRTYLESFRARQDSQISRFIRRIAKHAGKRFVLTSRTNILNRGEVLSDLLAETATARLKYEVVVEALSRLDRAKVLYNHLWHSGLDRAFVNEWHTARRYRLAVDHPNYNPRLIAFVVNPENVRARAAGDYWKYICDTLANPSDVWSFLFARQLSQHCRDLVIMVVLNGRDIAESVLRTIFLEHVRSYEAHPGKALDAYSSAVREATGAVLNRRIGHGVEYATYSLFNPSIADYVLQYLSEGKLWDHYFPAIRTPAALQQLAQLRREPQFGESQYYATLTILTEKEALADECIDVYSLSVAAMAIEFPTLITTYSSLFTRWFRPDAVDAVRVHPIEYFQVLRASRSLVDERTYRHGLKAAVHALPVSEIPIDPPDALQFVRNDLMMEAMEEEANLLRAKIIALWHDSIDEVIASEDVASHYFLWVERTQVEREVQAFVEERLTATGIEPSVEEIAELCSLIDPDHILDRNRDAARGEDDEAGAWGGGGASNSGDDAQIDDLFERSERPEE